MRSPRSEYVLPILALLLLQAGCIFGEADEGDVVPPDAVGDLTFVSATDSSLTLTWTAPGDDGSRGTAAQYDIRYSADSLTSETWNMAAPVTPQLSPHVAGTREAVTVGNLQPASSYCVALRTADEVPNWSALSNVVCAVTSGAPEQPDTIPPSTVIDLWAAGEDTTSRVNLTWTAPGDDGETGTAAAYEIRYDTEFIGNENDWLSAVGLLPVPPPGAGGTQESLSIESLLPDTTYYFALKAADEIPNWSEMSNVAAAVTGGPNDPPTTLFQPGGAPPDTLVVDSFMFEWVGVDADSDILATYYRLLVMVPCDSQSIASADTVPWIQVLEPNVMINFADVEETPDGPYVFQAQTEDEYGAVDEQPLTRCFMVYVEQASRCFIDDAPPPRQGFAEFTYRFSAEKRDRQGNLRPDVAFEFSWQFSQIEPNQQVLYFWSPWTPMVGMPQEGEAHVIGLQPQSKYLFELKVRDVVFPGSESERCRHEFQN